MSHRKIFLWIVGFLLCMLWAYVSMPLMHYSPHFEWKIDSYVITVWIIGWIPIIGFIALIAWVFRIK